MRYAVDVRPLHKLQTSQPINTGVTTVTPRDPCLEEVGLRLDPAALKRMALHKRSLVFLNKM
jgi:hypothetical protein